MDRGGIFAGDDPFAIARAWLAEAEPVEPNDPNAIALATVDATGMPNARMVLLKDIEPAAFVFYTNYGSRKGQEIAATGKAAFVLHWKSLRRQIRVRGRDEPRGGAAGGCLLHEPQPEEPPRCLGFGAVAATGLARGADGGGGEGHGRSTARRRSARRSGAASGSPRWRSSSGRMAHSGCTTGSDGRAKRSAGHGRSSG